MRQFAVLTRSLMFIMLRNRTTLFWNFAFPIGLLLLYGAIWGGQEFNGTDAMTWLTVGIVVLNIMSSGFMGDAAWLTTLRDQGILLRVQATPLSAGVLVGAYLVVRLLLIVVQSAIIVLVAVMIFAVSFTWGGVLSALFWSLLGAGVFIALGQAIAAIAPSSSAAVAIGQVCYFPLMFISNLFMPIETLPTWIAEISRWTPAYMLVDLMRPLLVPVPASQALWINGLGLLIYAIVGFMIAARFFRWTPRA